MTQAYDQPERRRTNVMWWARRFSTPLQQAYQAEAEGAPESADELIDLLEQAERRISTQTKGS